MKDVQLYGGAAVVRVPASWIDASTLRDVPSHQEVFVSPMGDESVIIEILEMSALSDDRVGEFYFSDLAQADDAASSVILAVQSVPGRFFADIITRVDVEGVQVKGKTAREQTPVKVYMTILRCPMVGSDILVTTHAETESARNIHREIAESLAFVDPHLFHA